MSIDLNAEQEVQASRIWNLVEVKVARFNAFLKRHVNYDFLGYVDLELIGRPGTAMAGFHFYSNGWEAKILKNGFYLDPKSEKPKATEGEPEAEEQTAGSKKKQKRFCAQAPGSAPTRAVLTAAVAAHPEIEAAIKQIATMEKPAAQEGITASVPAGEEPTARPDNPFRVQAAHS